jgi:glycosyltransferase involved in cell wall biosynthesis
MFNAARYVRQSVDSMLRQSFSDFELIVIDDGSTDGSGDIVSEYSDTRIVLFRQENQGLVASLNRGIAQSRGTYIARQDADDISLPSRLEKQVRFLDSHPEVAVVGAWAEVFNLQEQGVRFLRHPPDTSTLKFHLLFGCPFVHTSVMLRRSALDDVGGSYSTDPERQPPEDRELWTRLALHHDLANIPEVLVRYREVDGSLSRLFGNPEARRSVLVCTEYAARLMGQPLDTPDLRDLVELMQGTPSNGTLTTPYGRLRDLLAEVSQRVSPADSVLAQRIYIEARSRLLRLLPTYLRARYRGPLGRVAGAAASAVMHSFNGVWSLVEGTRDRIPHHHR